MLTCDACRVHFDTLTTMEATQTLPLLPPDDCYIHAGERVDLCEACRKQLTDLGFVVEPERITEHERANYII